VTEERRRRDITRPFAGFILLMVLVQIFPVYGLANRFEPMVFGLPFGLAWVIFWIAVELVVLLGFYFYEYGGRA
jgi:hypothetical protein